MKGNGLSIRAIAARLGRAGSTISRELTCNALESSTYRPFTAEGKYLLRRQRPARLEQDVKLRGHVSVRLLERWTPEQIAGRLGKGLDLGLGMTSAEAIYAWTYSKARRANALWLWRHLVDASDPQTIALPRKFMYPSEHRPPIETKR